MKKLNGQKKEIYNYRIIRNKIKIKILHRLNKKYLRIKMSKKIYLKQYKVFYLYYR